jgi:hypothetical protein
MVELNPSGKNSTHVMGGSDRVNGTTEEPACHVAKKLYHTPQGTFWSAEVLQKHATFRLDLKKRKIKLGASNFFFDCHDLT